MDVYPFTTTKVLRSYDPSTGGAKEDLAKIGQFKKFYRMVKEATAAFTMAVAHTVTVVEKPNRLIQFKALAAISQQMGVTVSKELEQAIAAAAPGGGNGGGGNRSWNGGNRSYNGGGYGGNRSGGYGGGNNYNRSQPSSQQPMASLDDPVDINLSINDMTTVDLTQFK